ncbi:UNVERIFIED_CONTAM: hypothetical protein K2H54_024610, partial [Gekko kuhli]
MTPSKGAQAEVKSQIVYPKVITVKEEETADPETGLIDEETSGDLPGDSEPE